MSKKYLRSREKHIQCAIISLYSQMINNSIHLFVVILLTCSFCSLFCGSKAEEECLSEYLFVSNQMNASSFDLFLHNISLISFFIKLQKKDDAILLYLERMFGIWPKCHFIINDLMPNKMLEWMHFDSLDFWSIFENLFGFFAWKWIQMWLILTLNFYIFALFLLHFCFI